MKKFKFYILFILVLFSWVKCNQSSNNKDLKSKLKGYLDDYKRYVFPFFESCENSIIKIHQYVSNEFNLEYPYDLLLFIVLGFLFYHLTSCFKSKEKFVYNFPDNPDISTLINNVASSF